MENNHADELMAAYLSGNIDAQEKADLMAWVDNSPEGRKFFDNAVSIWSAADEYVYPDFKATQNQAFNRLDDRLFGATTTAAPQPAKVRNLWPNVLRIAAAVALLGQTAQKSG